MTKQTAQALVASMKAQAKTAGCDAGCDLTRWMNTGWVISANCSVCHRIYSREA